MVNNRYSKKCTICWELIGDNIWVVCMECDIILHDKCFKYDNESNNRNYCLCPNCREVGTMLP